MLPFSVSDLVVSSGRGRQPLGLGMLRVKSNPERDKFGELQNATLAVSARGIDGLDSEHPYAAVFVSENSVGILPLSEYEKVSEPRIGSDGEIKLDSAGNPVYGVRKAFFRDEHVTVEMNGTEIRLNPNSIFVFSPADNGVVAKTLPRAIATRFTAVDRGQAEQATFVREETDDGRSVFLATF